MSRFGFRHALIRLLGGEVPEQEPVEEIEEVEVGAFLMTPEGPIPVPEGVHPLQFLMQMQRAGRQNAPSGPFPEPRPGHMPTKRAGPAGEKFALRVIDCVAQMNPADDPEVQHLLAAGWEPFGVHKFSSFTGAQGVRVYFRRGNTEPGGPRELAEG